MANATGLSNLDKSRPAWARGLKRAQVKSAIAKAEGRALRGRVD